ncbi:hypothetical protein MKW92_033686, partial [Papaver armeniacum]
MVQHTLCVVIRGPDTCPYHVNAKSTIDELKLYVCSYWNYISPDSIQFVFDNDGRSMVVDSDAKLQSVISMCHVFQLSFLELRLLERVPLRVPDYVREPTMSELPSVSCPGTSQLVIPCHLPKNKVT